MTTGSRNATSWWGQYEIGPGQARPWRFGALELTASWQPPEWRIAYAHQLESTDDEVVIGEPAIASSRAELGTSDVLRVMATDASGKISLSPALADRPVVVRPETSVLVLPGALIQLFLSTALWLRVEVGDPPHAVLDVPFSRPTDTWFGPSTLQGELCYAVRVNAQTRLEDLPVVSNRAVTRVLVENQTRDGFSLERLNVPAPNLSLYADATGHLWTQTMTVRLRSQATLAEIDFGDGPPDTAKEPHPVADPRTPLSRNILERAINALFL